VASSIILGMTDDSVIDVLKAMEQRFMVSSLGKKGSLESMYRWNDEARLRFLLEQMEQFRRANGRRTGTSSGLAGTGGY
jgi:hypothetical protein